MPPPVFYIRGLVVVAAAEYGAVSATNTDGVLLNAGPAVCMVQESESAREAFPQSTNAVFVENGIAQDILCLCWALL